MVAQQLYDRGFSIFPNSTWGYIFGALKAAAEIEDEAAIPK